MTYKTNVRFERFKSLNELAETIDSRPVNDVFKPREMNSSLGSQEKSTKYSSFYGSAQTFKQAIELMNDGYFEPLERMKREVLKIERKETAPKRRKKNHYVGGAVNVANALQGRPDSMIYREKRQEKEKTIHLLYGFSALGNVSADSLEKGGVMFVSLVNSLEKQGYRVKIDVVRATTSNNQTIGYLCNVKEYNQRTNLLKLCFPLVHPSMLRRISFRWCETLPELKDMEFLSGYGQSLIARVGQSADKEREILKRAGVLKDSNQYYCNVYEAMKSRNINELAEKMGLVR